VSDFENSQLRDDYRGPDRRRVTDCPVITEAQVALMVEEEVERRLAKFEDKLMLHLDAKFAQMHRIITDAFPGGDPHGHRAYHELQIKQANGWDQIKGEVISKVVTGGVWVGLGWLCFAVWQAIKSEVTK
jgi:hypothetical protein